MSRVTTYYNDNVVATFGPLSLTDMRAVDSWLSVTPKEDGFSEQEGVDGGVVRYSIGSKIYYVSMTFLGASAENLRLSAIYQADRAARNGLGILPMLIADPNGTSIFQTSQSWIKRPPDTTLAVDTGTREWMFAAVVEPSGYLIGGY